MNVKRILAGIIACTVVGGAVSPIVPQEIVNSVTANAEVDDDGNEYTEGDEGVLAYKKYSDHIEISGYYVYVNKDPEPEVIIPDTIEGLPVTSIGNGAFYYYEALESITIPDSVTSIGNSAFTYCHELRSITIPDGVTSIGNSAFASCYSLKSIDIPDSVTSIGNDAFYDCKALGSINIPDGVTSIGDYAFANCKSLKSIDIPDSVTSIGDNAFSGCESLKSINISNGVKYMGESIFEYCESLESITIPDSVENIGRKAFLECQSLKSIDVSENNEFYSSSDGVLFDKEKSELIQYPTGKEETSYSIPDGVKSIGFSAFYGCKSLKSITLPDGVTSIGHGGFIFCESLESINIPDSVTSIGDEAFFECLSLKSIIIPDGVANIGYRTFDGCMKLESITIKNPDCEILDSAKTICNDSRYDGVIRGYEGSTAQAYAEKYGYNFELIEKADSSEYTEGKEGVLEYKKYSDHIEISWCDKNITGKVVVPDTIEGLPVTSIGYGAFAYCYSIESIVIPDSVTSICEGAFQDCRSLKSINIPDAVTSIGEGAFSYCYLLESITLPDSITSIGKFTFECCESIESITVPNSITYIGYGAFSKCESLKSIIIENPECEIYNYYKTICNGYDDNEDAYFIGTIYGHEGSTAQAYAKKYDYKFDLIENAPKDDELKVTVSGDATDDGKVDIGDAVLIMQAVVNPDKYDVGGTDENAMTEQGKINADCYKPGSGVTPMDALAVQKLLLGNIDSLPEE